MKSQSALRLFLAIAVLAALPVVLSACTATDTEEAVSANPPPQNVEKGPPVAPAEAIPTIPDPQAEIWRPGYWAMSNGAFVWVPGRVIPRPSPTAVWASAHWNHHLFGWSFEEGHWE